MKRAKAEPKTQAELTPTVKWEDGHVSAMPKDLAEFAERGRRAQAAADEILSGIKKCRVCGCTDDDCSQCIKKTGAPCYWVEDDLCSACVGADEPIVTVAVATRSEKYDLEEKIRAAGGADSMMATVSVAMPPEMLAIIAHWKAMGQMPVLFIKPTAHMNEIRVIALRLPVEVASRI